MSSQNRKASKEEMQKFRRIVSEAFPSLKWFLGAMGTLAVIELPVIIPLPFGYVINWASIVRILFGLCPTSFLVQQLRVYDGWSNFAMDKCRAWPFHFSTPAVRPYGRTLLFPGWPCVSVASWPVLPGVASVQSNRNGRGVNGFWSFCRNKRVTPKGGNNITKK